MGKVGGSPWSFFFIVLLPRDLQGGKLGFLFLSGAHSKGGGRFFTPVGGIFFFFSFRGACVFPFGRGFCWSIFSTFEKGGGGTFSPLPALFLPVIPLRGWGEP